MLARGVVVTYETIRSWCAKFGPDYAAQLRRRRPRPGDKWLAGQAMLGVPIIVHEGGGSLRNKIRQTHCCGGNFTESSSTRCGPCGVS